jgi:hypothetical protein
MSVPPDDATEPVEALRRRLGELDPVQVEIWRRMTPAERIAVAVSAHRLAVSIARARELERDPDVSPEELAWRVTRRVQGDPNLGPKDG